MECSSGYSRQVLQVILPSERKVVCNIESQHTQIGDHNTTIVDTNIGDADDVPNIERLDLGETIANRTRREITIERENVQIVLGDENLADVAISTNREDSTLQIGNNNVSEISYPADRNQTCRAKRRRPKKKRCSKNNGDTSLSPSREAEELYHNFFREVLSVLHPLRDDGKWDEFDEKLNEFRVARGTNPIWDILLTLEHGLRMCYHSSGSHIKNAENKLFEGLHKVRGLKDLDPTIARLCKGRAYYYLASVYRRIKTFIGKAQECIDCAEECLRNTAFLYDKASLYYEKASLLLVFDHKGSQTKDIKSCLDKCAELCDEIKKHKNWEFVRKGYFAKVKKVMLLCSTKPGRKRKISGEDLKEAKKCLEELEEEGQIHCRRPSTGEQIVGLIAKSDTETCEGQYGIAKKTLEEAITLAKTHGFDELQALQRLDYIEKMIRQERFTLKGQEMASFDAHDSMSGDAEVSATADESECIVEP